MPLLDASHDRAHPVETDAPWSESYYFNCYDPDADVGFYTRVGVRPNEGTIDVGLAVWLPGGGIDHVGHVPRADRDDRHRPRSRPGPLRDARADEALAADRGRRRR